MGETLWDKQSEFFRNRPVLSREIRDLIRKMSRENPGWGAPRIHGELLKLGMDSGESSVSKYMVYVGRLPRALAQTARDVFRQPRLIFDDQNAHRNLPRTVSQHCTRSNPNAP